MVLFAGDNVDHNVRTIDEKGMFHGMGMVAALTPGKFINSIVLREKTTDLKVVECAKTDIIKYHFAKPVSSSIAAVFKELHYSHVTSQPVDIIWELLFAWLAGDNAFDSPRIQISWKIICDFLAYSYDWQVPRRQNLHFVNLGISVPAVITFGQSLYWKTMQIQNSSHTNNQLRNIVILLGRFHTLMNLLRATGTLMQGAGLEAILDDIYAKHAVVHILSGKAVQRTLCGYLLVDKCLNQMIPSHTRTWWTRMKRFGRKYEYCLFFCCVRTKDIRGVDICGRTEVHLRDYTFSKRRPGSFFQSKSTLDRLSENVEDGMCFD